MPRGGNSRYPYHLAKLVAERLGEQALQPPTQRVLLRLLEAMHFASLKTDEGRPCRCTRNYVAPDDDLCNRPFERDGGLADQPQSWPWLGPRQLCWLCHWTPRVFGRLEMVDDLSTRDEACTASPIGLAGSDLGFHPPGPP